MLHLLDANAPVSGGGRRPGSSMSGTCSPKLFASRAVSPATELRAVTTAQHRRTDIFFARDKTVISHTQHSSLHCHLLPSHQPSVLGTSSTPPLVFAHCILAARNPQKNCTPTHICAQQQLRRSRHSTLPIHSTSSSWQKPSSRISTLHRL